jgi:hypothetical protein
MKRPWERRLAALEARHGDGLSVNRLLIPCIIRPDTCSEPPNPCSFDDALPDNPARVVDLQGWRACSAQRYSFAPTNGLSRPHGEERGEAARLEPWGRHRTRRHPSRRRARRSASADLRINRTDLG